jgi:hypothetical protein
MSALVVNQPSGKTRQFVMNQKPSTKPSNHAATGANVKGSAGTKLKEDASASVKSLTQEWATELGLETYFSPWLECQSTLLKIPVRLTLKSWTIGFWKK